MMRFIDSYLEYLSTHPTEVNSIILWTISTAIVWFIMFRLKPSMVEGAKGENKLFDLPEQVSYIVLWMHPPVVFYFAFFQSLIFTLYYLGAVAAYTVGGRWLFQWALALRAGSTEVKTDSKPEPEQKP